MAIIENSGTGGNPLYQSGTPRNATRDGASACSLLTNGTECGFASHGGSPHGPEPHIGTPDASFHFQSPALSAKGFTFAYPASETCIGPIAWQVPQGAFQLLVGATGSGKTTLLKAFKPAIAPHGEQSGQLEVFGTPVGQISEFEAATSVGYVSQSPENQLVCDTVWHELAFGLENIGTDQDTMRRRIAEVAHFFGIEPWFRRQIDSLSGGQKQIVTLASVLAMRPRILVLDEPTSQLDPVAEKNFLHALFRVNRELGITVVVATHAPETMAAYATSAVRLENGGLTEAQLSTLTCGFLDLATLKRGSGEESIRSVDPAGSAVSSSDATGSVTALNPASLSGSAAPVNPPSDSPANCANAQREQESKRPQPARQPAIQLQDLYVRYDRKSDWVLRGLDLAVKPGEIHALIGGNGCGKSTLLQVIAGTLKSERGQLRNTLRKSQALLPQDPKALFVCDTVAEELTEWQKACGYSNEAIERAASWVNLAQRLGNHPYDLSGGQQQLLALAKLLLTNPKLLLLDEPTKGLDPQSKLAVAQKLREEASTGTTIVIATHDLPFAALVADVATMLFDGQSAATQPAAGFFNDNLFYRPLDDSFAKLWRNRPAGEHNKAECHGE
jgi:energy-coupling factor transport system ATP-binding protein